MNKLISWRPKNLKYYHLAFTIPEELRPFFKRHRAALSTLPYTASETLFYFFWKKHKCKPWLLSVIHTFGAQLNRNPHVHVMVTSWWINSNGAYKSIDFIPYKGVLLSRKKGLLRHLRYRCKEHLEWQNLNSELYLLNKIYSQKSDHDPSQEKSWYIYFSKKANSFEVVLSYIGRYLKRPVISQSRILSYNGKDVTFSYKDKKDWLTKIITTSAIDFIWLLIQHIPNKFFKMVHYSGIFANRSKHTHLKIINRYFNNTQKTPLIPTNFRDRILAFTGKDPLLCSCGWCFYKYRIAIPWYPDIYFDSS